MKRRRGSPTTAHERAEARVERVLRMVARQDVPLWGGSPLGAHRDLGRARRLAERFAVEAGRDDLLEAALARVAQTYALRLGDMGVWTAIAAIPVPFDARARAESQMVLRDLVTAAVVEDLLPQDVLARLRADSEPLLGPVEDDAWAPTPRLERAPPREPFLGPLVAGGRIRGLVAVVVVVVVFLPGLLYDWADQAFRLIVVTAAIAVVLLVALWRRWEAGRSP
jgi:hypothetical protein